MVSQHHTAVSVRVPARSAISTMEALRGGTPSVDGQASEEGSTQVAGSVVAADSMEAVVEGNGVEWHWTNL